MTAPERPRRKGPRFVLVVLSVHAPESRRLHGESTHLGPDSSYRSVLTYQCEISTARNCR
jgi:hypothetical protein